MKTLCEKKLAGEWEVGMAFFPSFELERKDMSFKCLTIVGMENGKIQMYRESIPSDGDRIIEEYNHKDFQLHPITGELQSIQKPLRVITTISSNEFFGNKSSNELNQKYLEILKK
ncbi:MAG: hypothetical protein QT05_C0026G0003 [archaeon GW2011_AR13]|nr:MAG: hypothetical protein QT05_C0026G0003 [archaeon GW2011_AR13]HIG95160.1 hypothetical protein [Nanoarchaeota archaeon]HIH63400.1 hypothetical protein [Nanoarchaeota archaeon]HIJ09837.1 hypothetical protein [Nanoarchaeota archaeon]